MHNTSANTTERAFNIVMPDWYFEHQLATRRTSHQPVLDQSFQTRDGSFAVPSGAPATPSAHGTPNEGAMWDIIENRRFDFHYQPVLDLKSRRVVAEEMLMRPHRDTGYVSPGQMFDAARLLSLHGELDLACAEAALERSHEIDLPPRVRLHINLNSDTIGDPDKLRRLLRLIEERVPYVARRITIELTETEPLNHSGVDDFVNLCKKLGVAIALDDFGVGYGNLHAWLQFKPDVIKIDRYFIDGLAQDPAKQELLKGMKQMAEITGTLLLAEGVETAEELRMTRSLGVQLAQGYLVARPHPAPLCDIRREALDVMGDAKIVITTHAKRSKKTESLLRNLCERVPSLPTSVTAKEVVQFFNSNQNQPSVALTDEEGHPEAILSMAAFMNLMAQPYRMDIYGQRPAIGLCNRAPVVKDIDTAFDELMLVLTEADQRYLTDGIVITERGKYVGLCQSHHLIQQVTANRIEAARHANPLTLLPGNLPINAHLERMMESDVSFAVAYADLNHFKAFNDRFGYWKGDELIQIAANAIREFTDPLHDFVGHVGGDDFVVILQSNDWLKRIQSIVQEAALRIARCYPDEARESGGHEAEDRFGVVRFFPLVTLSFGVIPVPSKRTFGQEQLMTWMAEAKKLSKTAKGNIYVQEVAQPTPPA